MQHLFEQLERFVASPLCIFEWKPFDYPTALQQRLICAHFELASLLKSTAHSEIVRLLHSSVDKQLELFIPGLLYALFLDSTLAQRTFETYMPVLRSESWVALDRLLQQLIRESFLSLKPTHRSALVVILGRLSYFNQLSADLLSLAIKTMDAFDFSDLSLSFNSALLEFFQTILAQSAESDQLKAVLADRLFYKLIRMITILNAAQDESTREYRRRCVAIAYRLMAFGKERSLAMGWTVSGVMRELETDESMAKLLEECREELIRSPPPENPAVTSMRLSMLLPIRVETTLRFIIQEEVSQLETGVQMNWVFNRLGDHSQPLLVDILRYLLALSPQELPEKQGLYLLEWLFYRSCSNNVLFEFWKGELFRSCFTEPCQSPAAPERALRFLSYLLQTNFDFGETLLVYLLRQMSIPAYSKRLRQLLIDANTLQILDLNSLLTNSRLSPRAKAELRAAVGDCSVEVEVQRFKDEEAQAYYNPLEEMQRRESEIEVEFSPSESSEHFDGYEEQEPAEITHKQETGMRVKVEKMFAEDLGQNLAKLMMEPNLTNYKEFFRKLMEEIKTFKVNGQAETIELFISETAKLTYLLFQNQFEDHSATFAKEENTIVHLLSVVAAEWRTNSLLGQCSKKLIRKIIDYFPTAEPGIWRHFLLHFRRAVVAQTREMKEWLIPREKAEYAIPLLKELGPISKELLDNAQQLKLPIC